MGVQFEHYHDRIYRELSFPDAPDGRPYVFSNMIASIDGKAVVEENERGLGSRADQALMRRLRAHADMVLTGAGTFRASGAGARIDDESIRESRVARGRTANPIAAVATNRGGLDLSRQFFTATDYEAVVFAGPAVPADEIGRMEATGRSVVRVPEGTAGLAHLVHVAASQFAVERLLVEGGPGLLAGLLRLDLLDEFFQTVTGKVVGGSDTLTLVEGERLAVSELPAFDLVSVIVNTDENELYLRWRRRRG